MTATNHHGARRVNRWRAAGQGLALMEARATLR
jgi:hypothetical protein